MIKIRTSKQEGELNISFVLQTSKIKQGIYKFFRSIYLRLKIFLILLRAIFTKSHNFLIETDGEKSSFSFSWKRPSISKLKQKAAKVIASLMAITLILNVSMVGSFLSSVFSASAEEMCLVDVDVVMVMDVSGSMTDGENPSQCDWWNLEKIGPSYQWVSHVDYDVTQEWCDEKDKSPHHPSAYTPATQSKIDSAKNAASSFIDNL